MSGWKEFGKFVFDLKQGRDELPPDVKARVHQIADPLPTVEEKIAALYHYLQKNTRYISIQLGIGGFQPFDAKFVAQKAYGDCKALTNYMFSLLKEAGIRSHYSLVCAGKYDTYLNVDFPSQQFNHVILSVPLSKDTAWLECTSQTLPAGYLGDFTGNRQALLITEEGGKLVNTVKYEAKDNVQERIMDGVLAEDGTLSIKSITSFTGLQLDDVHHLINQLTSDKVKEYLQEQLNLATYDIVSFSYKEDKTLSPEISEALDLVVSNYATVTGKRLFITPNILNRSGMKLTEPEKRQFDVVLPMAFHDLDSISIQVPDGYRPESMPADTELKTPFGEYKSRVVLQGRQLNYYRDFIFYGGRHPAESYSKLVKFFDDIHKADRARVVLVK
jgi:hypothetical protein